MTSLPTLHGGMRLGTVSISTISEHVKTAIITEPFLELYISTDNALVVGESVKLVEKPSAADEQPVSRYFAAMANWASEKSDEAKSEGRFFVLRNDSNLSGEAAYFIVQWIPEELGVKRKML